MKRYIFLMFGLFFSLIINGQNNSLLKDAQSLFASGNYTAAVSKYKECVNKLSGRERNIAQVQLLSAESCVEAMAEAKKAETAKNYDKAIEEYQKVLDSNPDDTKAKELQEAVRKAKREANPTLSISNTSMNFGESGGTQKITINCSMSWTFTSPSSSMCSVTRNGNELTITCYSNPNYSSRNTSFTVKTTNGVKEQKVFIYQSAATYTTSSYSSSSSSSSSRSSGYGGSSYRSKRDKVFQIGADVSWDIFKPITTTRSTYGYSSYYYSGMYDEEVVEEPMGFGLGLRARLGNYDNLVNLIGGVRYVWGDYPGFMFPVILNFNLLESDLFDASYYLGIGYEFSSSEKYKEDLMLQLGICGEIADFQLYYKPTLEAFGLGLTFYF